MSSVEGTGNATRRPSPWVHSVAGQVAGMTGIAVVHPVDTVKCRLQAHTAGEPLSALGTARELVLREGSRGLYKGLGAPLAAFGLVNAVNFTVHSRALSAFERLGVLGRHRRMSSADGSQWRPSTSGQFLAGAVTGVASSLVRGPVERVKTVLQADHGRPRYKGSLDCARQLVREYGVARGLFTGTGATMVREIPQMGLYFLSYEAVKERTLAAVGSENTSVATAFAGGCAGVIQWAPTYPLDVLKTRIQAAPPGTYDGLWQCATHSVRTEGAQVLWRGLGIALFRAFPLHGTIFLTCEHVREVLIKLDSPDGLLLRSEPSATAAARHQTQHENLFRSCGAS